MSDSPPQSALREWGRHMSAPGTLAITAGIGCVLALAGPFGTDRLLPLLPRLGYWLVMVFATYGAGVLVGILIEPRLTGRPMWQRVLAVGSLTALLIAAVVLGFNLVVFRWHPTGSEWPAFLGTLWAITVIVTAAIAVAGQQRGAAAPLATPDAPNALPSALPAILDRLPLDKRGALVALSVQDHYVEIRTTKGQELLLMRLSDAMREVGETPGAQVHRSHWAAFGQVSAARRSGDRAILTMSDGTEVPVSRANLPKIKEAGLLPR